jgi:hypothetical protein
MKKCSASSPIKEMQIKTSLRFHLTPHRMDIIKKTNTHHKCCEDAGEKKTLIHGWECKFVQPL